MQGKPPGKAPSFNIKIDSKSPDPRCHASRPTCIPGWATDGPLPGVAGRVTIESRTSVECSCRAGGASHDDGVGPWPGAAEGAAGDVPPGALLCGPGAVRALPAADALAGVSGPAADGPAVRHDPQHGAVRGVGVPGV